MAYIYAFAPDAEDCSTIGLVGALLDEDAAFELRAGEFGELTFRHPIDPYGKWRVLVNGAILKTMVPMRLCPGVKEDGTYITSVDEYAVAATATKNQRYIYSKKEKGKKKKLLKAGAKVTVTGVADASDAASRYKVKLGKVSGWMERAGLTLTQRATGVPAAQGGIETAEPSYAVRQQLFRIQEVSPSGGEGGSVSVRALRIAYDLLGNLSFYRENGGVTCREACEGVLRDAIMPHDFSIFTDIGDSHAGFDAWDKNPIAALVDPEAGVTARWDAEVVADDYDIYILRRAGLDRGVSIAYGRNLTGIEVRIDASGACSAIRPRGEKKDGTELYLDGRVVNGRHGYNYNSASRTCADWLPEGYQFYTLPDGTVRGSTIVRAGFSDGVPPKLALLEVKDAKVEKGSANITTAVARRMLAEAAVARFEGGCEAPEIAMDVDFVMLGDTAEYAQYRHLEPLFIYDTVRISHAPLGIRAEISLTAIRWLVRAERVSKASFGALTDVTASISGWQLSSVDGGKIAANSLGAAQLQDGIVSARLMQAGAVSAEAIDTESLTAGTAVVQRLNAAALEAVRARLSSVTAETITTDTLAAAFASLARVTAEEIEAGRVDAGSLAAGMAKIVTLQAGVGSFDLETVKNLVSSALTLERGQANSMVIANLAVTSANLLNATIGSLVLRGEDGDYYEVSVGSDGGIRAAAIEVTDAEADAGRLSDGRRIVEETVNARTLAGQTVTAREAILNTVLTAALDAGQITAAEAMLASASIPMLYATSIAALGQDIDISANRSITLLAGETRRMLRLDDAGVHVGDDASGGEVLIDSESVNVVLNGRRYSRFGADYAQFGNYQVRRSADGGLVFKLKE